MTVEERLTKLEKAIKRWRIVSLGLAGGVAVLAAGLGWSVFGVRGAVRAREFIVVNEKGAAAEISASDQGEGLIILRDGMNLTRVMLGTSQRGCGTAELYAGNQQKLVLIGGTGSGGQMAIYNNSGSKVVDLQAIKTNCGAVVVNDFDGRFVQGITGDTR